MRSNHIHLATLMCALALTGCRDGGNHNGMSEVAVTNSYLACAVWDVCGDDVDVLCLAPPGVCPGHFDISPSQVRQLCNCKLLLCFDFQKGIEKQLSRLRQRGLKTALVSEAGGLCVPQTYLTICRQVVEILSNEYPQRRLQLQERLAAIEKELGAMHNELMAQMKGAGLTGVKTLASRHQADFVKWLGLEVVGTFAGSDSETVSNVSECLRQAQGLDVRFVVANKQEGATLAEALAERLEAKTVVLSNFPQTEGRSEGFSEMIRVNVHSLIEAAGG